VNEKKDQTNNTQKNSNLIHNKPPAEYKESKIEEGYQYKQKNARAYIKEKNCFMLAGSESNRSVKNFLYGGIYQGDRN
jgi:hypothetical protein